MEPFRVKLTTPQVQKLHRGQNFQFSNDDLKNGGKGIHDYGIQLSQNGHKALMRNMKANKGFRFSTAHIEGHGLWEHFKNAAKKGFDFAKKVIPKEYVKEGLKKGAHHLIDKGVDYVYSEKGKGLQKGSSEMKEKMARLRAMRGIKNHGGDLFDDARDAANKIKAKISDTIRPIGKYGKKPTFIQDARNVMGVGLVQDARDYLGVGLVQDARDYVGVGLVQDARDYIGVGMEKGTGGNSSRPLTRQMGLRPRHLIKGSPEAKAYMASIRAKSKKRKGSGMWDWADPNKNGLNDSIQKTNNAASQALDPNQNGVAKAFDPYQNGVAKAFNLTASQVTNVANSAVSQAAESFKRGGSAEDFGKKIASALIHQGIPEATAFLCSSLATAAFPAGGPVVGWAASAAGKELGKMIAKKVGEETGYGIRGHHAKYSSRIHTVGGQFVKGIPLPIYTNQTIDRIQTHGLMNHHRNKNGLYNGGSFLPMGSKGGSFVSP